MSWNKKHLLDIESLGADEIYAVLDTARAVATLDVLASLAETAAIHNFTKPQMHDGDESQASDARHPIV